MSIRLHHFTPYIFVMFFGFTFSTSAVDIAIESKPNPSGSVDFLSDIQPIFNSHCVRCHGEEKSEAGLRLDSMESVLRGSQRGPIIDVGHSVHSKLLAVITATGDEQAMPPEGKRLTTEQIALLKLWIDDALPTTLSTVGIASSEKTDGALKAHPLRDSAKNHWSLQPVHRPQPPAVANETWLRNEIDRFVLSPLEAQGITPSPRADRRTLIRRLYLDLIGLPPTAAEAKAFAENTNSNAYAELVEHLLKSPHYGERWGRHWLDQARYADSEGYDMDQPRPHAWRYRHWVVEALNRDLPFDQFTIEQLAGDLLPNPTTDQRAATGFHRNTLWNTEAGNDPEEDRVKRTVDRTNTTAITWLGLTMNCCQCHDHKFDPITQREYFGLYAFFNSLQEQEASAPLEGELEAFAPKKKSFDEQFGRLMGARDRYEEKFAGDGQKVWEANFEKIPVGEWKVAKIIEADSEAEKGEDFRVLDDGSILVTGPTPDETTYTVVTETDLATVTAIRIEVLPHESLPNNGPGRAPDGDFDLTALTVYAELPSDDPNFIPPLPDGTGNRPVDLVHAAASYSRPDRKIEAAIGDYGQKSGWSIGPKFGKPQVMFAELRKPIPTANKKRLRFVIRQGGGGWFQVVGRFRISVSDTPVPFRMEGIPGTAGELLAIPEAERTEEQKKIVRRYYCSSDLQWLRMNEAAMTRLRLAPKDPNDTKALIVTENPQPRKTHVLYRGDFLRPLDEVQPHTPSILPPLKARSERPDRLDLAQWLVDPQHPLTARVAVNRVWQKYFGRALVRSEDDFGLRGQQPTHPELLDWLASEFVAKGWSMKELHRLIVMSATYQQASDYRPELAEADPNNEWLARQNRLQLEAEIVRDIGLSVSGMLSAKVGGPCSVMPQASGREDLAFNRSARLKPTWGDQLMRRGLYIWIQRTSPYPTLTAFDAPNANVTCTRRERSVTPMQSLIRLNDDFFFEYARNTARAFADIKNPVVADGSALDDRLTELFSRCLSRPPMLEELEELRDVYHVHRKFYKTYPHLAREITTSLGVDPSNEPALGELATWTVLSRIVMNLEEFITRE